MKKINKPKHSKKKKKREREIEEQNGKTHIQEDKKRNHLRGQTTKGNIKFPNHFM
jgi:hypothetical protein